MSKGRGTKLDAMVNADDAHYEIQSMTAFVQEKDK
jgi:hypothetical protein